MIFDFQCFLNVRAKNNKTAVFFSGFIIFQLF